MATHVSPAPRRIAGAGAGRGALPQTRLRLPRRHHHRATCRTSGRWRRRWHAAPLSWLTWIAIGRCLRRFHDLGVCHADLNAHNILIGQAQGSIGLPAGSRLPDRFRSRESAQAGFLAGRKPGAPAPLAGEDHLGIACRPVYRGRLARPARRLSAAAARRRVNPHHETRKRLWLPHRFCRLRSPPQTSCSSNSLPTCSRRFTWPPWCGAAGASPESGAALASASAWARRSPAPVWLHAASVGEVQAAAILVTALRERDAQLPLLVTTTTAAGLARARALFAASGIAVRYAPLDLPGSVRRFLQRVQPRLAIVLETEIWPNLFRACATAQVPLVLVECAHLRNGPRGAIGGWGGPCAMRWRAVAQVAAQTCGRCAALRGAGRAGRAHCGHRQSQG